AAPARTTIGAPKTASAALLVDRSPHQWGRLMPVQRARAPPHPASTVGHHGTALGRRTAHGPNRSALVDPAALVRETASVRETALVPETATAPPTAPAHG